MTNARLIWLLYASPAALVCVLHLFSWTGKTSVTDTATNQRSFSMSDQISSRGLYTDESYSVKLSNVFGIVVEQTTESAAEEARSALLNVMSPRLVAVDQLNTLLTAYLVTSESSKGVRVKLDDELNGYKLSYLDLHRAVFTLSDTADTNSDNPDTITLELFELPLN